MDLFAPIRAEILGEGRVIETPYGRRRLTYADHAASGRAYRPIERLLCEQVLPLYGNVHSETSAVAAQTNAFREEARRIIKQASGCGPQDAAIFTGNGVTAAVNLLIGCMGLCLPCDERERPVAFIGPFEHHSNELPWHESVCDVVVIRECEVDGIDLDDLAAKLEEHEGRRLIGSFSAASNVTGRISNVEALATLMHDHGGVAFFDYAAAGPYVDIRMDNPQQPLGYADAVFLSMHKFVGGPGAPGVLLAKNHLFSRPVPAVPGGGTISYVSPHKHVYLENIEHREEGGTPNIPGSIRAGLAVRLKMQASGAWPDGSPYDCLNPTYADGTPYGRRRGGIVGTAPPTELRRNGACDPHRENLVLEHEQRFAAAAIAAWRDNPNLTVLGNLDEPRLGIVSFLVCHEGKPIHHNFVVALLNDLFGIQARGGNSCAAPYAHRLLRVGDREELEIEACVAAGWHGCKPGWTRISFGWYDSPETLDFIIQAVNFIAAHGHRFLPDYTFNPKSGTWKHRNFTPELLSLSSPVEVGETLPESVRPNYLAEALALAEAPRATVPLEHTPFEHIRWFSVPGEL